MLHWTTPNCHSTFSEEIVARFAKWNNSARDICRFVKCVQSVFVDSDRCAPVDDGSYRWTSFGLSICPKLTSCVCSSVARVCTASNQPITELLLLNMITE